MTTPIPSWEERFDKMVHDNMLDTWEVKFYKELFRTEIEAARKEERDEIVGIIEKNMWDESGRGDYVADVAKVLKQITSRNQQ